MQQKADLTSAAGTAISVPEKHFPKWLQVYSHITELKLWMNLTKFVLSLATIAGLTIYIGNKSPEALKDFIPIMGAILSLAGIGIGIHKYINRDKRDDD